MKTSGQGIVGLLMMVGGIGVAVLTIFVQLPGGVLTPVLIALAVAIMGAILFARR